MRSSTKSNVNVFTPSPMVRREPIPSAVEESMALSLCEQGRFEEAETFGRDLTARYPRSGFAWKLLGLALAQTKGLSVSLEPMQQAARLAPMDPEAFNNLGGTLQGLERLAHAEACYRRAVELKPDFVGAIENLAEVLQLQGKRDEAQQWFERKLKLVPDDGYAAHLVAAFKGHATDRAPDKYVATVFDAYAGKFDDHLQGSLQYKIPQQLAELVGQRKPASGRTWRVLDLGCGTGLAGQAFSSMSKDMVGVDLSPKMLDKARERGVYQRLEQADVLAMMRGEDAATYDIVVAADVFVYIGKIDEIVQEARRLLRPDGVLVFSVEDLISSTGAADAQGSLDYQLRQTGRYAQSTDYVGRLAAEHGFVLEVLQETNIRFERDVPVPGHIALYRVSAN